jgi:hypothetical protein
MAAVKDIYIFYDNNTYESKFIVIDQEDDPLLSREEFKVSGSNVVVTTEYIGFADGKWVETKGLEKGPFTYPYKFIDGKLQINDTIYTKISR